ncbi:MAG: hypothetical protein CMM81_11260 [Rhodospirillales bacterium]|jgi:hypothetical protein|nr:hypothetical protein [Rhodospirillales bacterium]
MKLTLLSLVVSGLVFFATQSITHATALPTVTQNESIAHGGGCRKSSPPGQCCHMDNKAGSVHCH